jgi:hypothetical protein
LKKGANMDFFLDSGAFSAYTKGVEIDIKEYCDFIKEHQDIITHYAVLDVIGSAEGTLKNQQFMEEQGLHPVPCYHYGEDTKYLEHYVANYDYVAIGGMVPVSTKDLLPWLDRIFAKHICNDDGYPRCKTHGFGLTTISLMVRYPWYSVDSTSWVMTGRFGAIFVPRRKQGKWSWLDVPLKINVSSQSPKLKEEGKHYQTMNDSEKAVVDLWLQECGYVIGKSTFENGEETIIEEGVSNKYQMRDQMNIIYFRELENHFKPYPWKFKTKHSGGLFR